MASAPRQLLAILWPSAPLGMSLGPPYARALAIPSYFSRGGVPKDRGVAPRRFPHFWFYDGYKKKKVPRGRRRDRSKFNSLCQRGEWLRRANGGGRAPGTGAALRPVLAGIRAMNGTLSAKRCVKLAPCSAAEAPCTGLSASAWEWPASALGGGGEVSSPPQIVQLRIAAAISRGGQCRSNTV